MSYEYVAFIDHTNIMALILILPSSTRLATSTHNRCVWHTILDQCFPINAGYIVRDEAPHKYGGSDIGVYEHRLNARKRHVFLIIQCERARHQAKPAKWTQAESQLQRSLSTVHGKKKVGQRSPVYGAVAMGRKIKSSNTSTELATFRPGDQPPGQTRRTW